MPMLMWLPMVVMAGIYQAVADDFSAWHRACVGANDHDEG
jgi:hypothetical protein